MLGKPEWFRRRKYGGWGIQPKTWQGWVYIAVFLLPFAIFNIIPMWDAQTRLIVAGIWIALLVIDVFDIMIRLKDDERERLHEALAERNALWGIIIVLVIGVFYDVVTSAMDQRVYVNPFIAAALVVGLLIKSASNIYLDRRD